MKPDNILVCDRGAGDWQIRVADFGSGRLLQPSRLAELGITQTGLTDSQTKQAYPSGTALYLAPELLQGRSATV